MKELKYFNQLSEYNSNKDNFEYPTVSYVEENKEVYYMEKEKPYAIYKFIGQLELHKKLDCLDMIPMKLRII